MQFLVQNLNTIIIRLSFAADSRIQNRIQLRATQVQSNLHVRTRRRAQIQHDQQKPSAAGTAAEKRKLDWQFTMTLNN